MLKIYLFHKAMVCYSSREIREIISNLMAKAFFNKKNFVRKRSTNITLILNSVYDVILISVLDNVENSNLTLSLNDWQKRVYVYTTATALT